MAQVDKDQQEDIVAVRQDHLHTEQGKMVQVDED
jgi:hypothetical protein